MQNYSISVTAAIFVTLAFVSTSFATDVKDIKDFTLENGMEFLVLEDHSIPNANMKGRGSEGRGSE
ncbi:MAG: hypothetical protein JKY88_13235 [Pseudomonadales bacterium]|nr:hypothetical protein [Pseudomonadales bacterium]